LREKQKKLTVVLEMKQAKKLTVVLEMKQAKKLTVVLDNKQAIEKYGRVGFLL
jgi:hypothetical protein